MEERYLTGYCRCLDASRIVEVVTEDEKLAECDCSYGNCKFQSQCTIAQGIEEMTEAEN